MNTTGKLDKLIEDKVDQKIRVFSNNIANQIKDFLKANGDYSGDHLYQPTGWENSNCGSYNVPIDYKYRSVHDLSRNIKGGLEISIKGKMIERETKDLLAKVELLS
jgi:hypothetical protein